MNETSLTSSQSSKALGGPQVSVVITTMGRPELVRAVESALKQQLPPCEVIVVDDRPADHPVPALETVAAMDDVVVVRSGGRGANAARNMGISAAKGGYVALLDDDDIWFPNKLLDQISLLNEVNRSAMGNDLVSCQMVDEKYGRVRPRYPTTSSAIDRWLFCPRWYPLRGDAVMQTSGLLFPVEVGRRVAFDETLRTHQDWDWLLKFAALPDSRFHTVPEPLYLYSAGASGKTSESKRLAEEQSWAISTLPLRSQAMFGYFMTLAAPKAIEARDYRMMLLALRRAITRGQPHVPSLIFGLGAMVLSEVRSRRARER